MVQIQPTHVADRFLESHQREVGGWFRSGLRNKAGPSQYKRDLSFMDLLSKQLGSEQSTVLPLAGFLNF